MRTVLTAMVLSVFLLFHGCGVDDGIIGDVKQLRKVNGRIDVDISDIVKKHIAIGEKREVVERYLVRYKFRVHYVPILAGEQEAIVAVHIVESSRNILGFHDEIRVIVDFESSVVSSVSGRIIYRMT
ncbi:hypothetical protein ACPRNU_23100 [Chromobacterium vaccinii]|uniref:hypothetical protein n=1 Tax=Chromobacterium vaccinii TaxID=1108595 RepID=UPI003C760031